MSPRATRPRQSSTLVRRLVVFGLAGPPIGCAVLLAALLLPVAEDGLHWPDAAFLVTVVVVGLPVAYILGLVPALAAGWVHDRLDDRGPAVHWAGTVIAGAAASAPVVFVGSVGPVQMTIFAALALAGSVAALACSGIDRWVVRKTLGRALHPQDVTPRWTTRHAPPPSFGSAPDSALPMLIRPPRGCV